MDFEKFKKINDERPNYGEIEDADVVSFYRNSGCGDGYRIFLKIKEENNSKIIENATFTTTGCGFSITALAMGIEWIKGKSLEEAENITVADIESLFLFPERRKNYPQSAIAAIKKAINDYKKGIKCDYLTKKRVLEKLKINGHLRNENLQQVMLDNEDLSNVDFSGANLQNAFLQSANLENANFEGANLRGAYLNMANLKNANFRNADLRFAKLIGANIEGAIFENAIYDIGTRLDPKQIHIFKVMKKADKGFIELKTV
ncbi:MAG: hypothetical protein KatS3mg129_1604 [Leptospiraceae bacterium]|nr:MAG: hypothetical protein KatS3mg129_1604 [Leptospiraceae bacterium]